MSLTIDPKLEAKIREYAEAEGLTPEVYVEQLVEADQSAIDEIEALALEGLNSGDPIQAGPEFWDDAHRRLDERLKKGSF